MTDSSRDVSICRLMASLFVCLYMCSLIIVTTWRIFMELSKNILPSEATQSLQLVTLK